MVLPDVELEAIWIICGTTCSARMRRLTSTLRAISAALRSWSYDTISSMQAFMVRKNISKAAAFGTFLEEGL